MEKKILIVSSEFPPGPGGIGNHAYSLAKHLAKKEFAVDLVVDSNYAEEKEIIAFDRQLPASLCVNRIKRDGWKTYYRRIQCIRRQLKKNEYTVVIFSGKFSLWMSGWFKTFGYKLSSLAVLHGSEIQMSDWFQKWLTEWGIGRCDYLLPVSEFTHSLLSDKLKKKKYSVIPNGIDLSEFEELKETASNSNFKLWGSPALLTVGNVTPRKGQHRVIKALPDILKKYPEAHYHVVGLPSYKEKFMALAQELNVDKAITFHGRLPGRDDLTAAYAQADCFLILSENQSDGDVEGFGIVILEANHFGLPAIGAQGCGISDAIENGYNGYLVDGDNGFAITNQLENILENKSVFAENAIRWAHKHDWDLIVDRYITRMEELNIDS